MSDRADDRPADGVVTFRARRRPEWAQFVVSVLWVPLALAHALRDPHGPGPPRWGWALLAAANLVLLVLSLRPLVRPSVLRVDGDGFSVGGLRRRWETTADFAVTRSWSGRSQIRWNRVLPPDGVLRAGPYVTGEECLPAAVAGISPPALAALLEQRRAAALAALARESATRPARVQ